MGGERGILKMANPSEQKWHALHDADGDFSIYAGNRLVAITAQDNEWDEEVMLR